MIGTRLAHYEITSHLGSGGMGDVYEASDSKLGRSVAIKLLPEAFTHDADRAARFEREARVLASLNHPNIAAIYGIEQSGGRTFLVMELVPGETLAERIRRGPIPVPEALDIATQIAEALEAAHDSEKTIVHRDLKPANVKLTPDGRVKVLDFGLAKAYEAPSAQTNLSQSPTMSMAATMQGVILGTAAYMSPEQASGKPVDKRADIWSFGVVLWEMLTGRGLFGGETISHTLADVLRAPIDFSQLPAGTPGRGGVVRPGPGPRRRRAPDGRLPRPSQASSTTCAGVMPFATRLTTCATEIRRPRLVARPASTSGFSVMRSNMRATAHLRAYSSSPGPRAAAMRGTANPSHPVATLPQGAPAASHVRAGSSLRSTSGQTRGRPRQIAGAADVPYISAVTFKRLVTTPARRSVLLLGPRQPLFFWRTNHGAEVDRLVEKHGRLLGAIEIKSTGRVTGAHLEGLRSFADDHANVPHFVVTPSGEPRKLEGTLVTNWCDFLEQFRGWL